MQAKLPNTPPPATQEAIRPAKEQPACEPEAPKEAIQDKEDEAPSVTQEHKPELPLDIPQKEQVIPEEKPVSLFQEKLPVEDPVWGSDQNPVDEVPQLEPQEVEESQEEPQLDAKSLSDGVEVGQALPQISCWSRTYEVSESDSDSTDSEWETIIEARREFSRLNEPTVAIQIPQPKLSGEDPIKDRELETAKDHSLAAEEEVRTEEPLLSEMPSLSGGVGHALLQISGGSKTDTDEVSESDSDSQVSDTDSEDKLNKQESFWTRHKVTSYCNEVVPYVIAYALFIGAAGAILYAQKVSRI